jgi:hypothetical protein
MGDLSTVAQSMVQVSLLVKFEDNHFIAPLVPNKYTSAPPEEEIPATSPPVWSK